MNSSALESRDHGLEITTLALTGRDSATEVDICCSFWATHSTIHEILLGDLNSTPQSGDSSTPPAVGLSDFIASTVRAVLLRRLFGSVAKFRIRHCSM